MPARTTAELLAELEAFIPPEYRPLRPHLAGRAAMMQLAEACGFNFADAATIGGAEGIWLTLHAKGYGVGRSDDELDADLRDRLRNVPDQLTRPNLLSRANAVLASYDNGTATMYEHFDSGFYLDGDSYFDIDALYDRHNAFTLVVAMPGDFPHGESYLDGDEDCFLDDDLYLGGGTGDPPVFDALIAAIDPNRAAGVRWRIVAYYPETP